MLARQSTSPNIFRCILVLLALLAISGPAIAQTASTRAAAVATATPQPSPTPDVAHTTAAGTPIEASAASVEKGSLTETARSKTPVAEIPGPANPPGKSAPVVQSAPGPQGTTSQPRRAEAQVCKRMISADVIALDQPYMVNRMGAIKSNGMIFALRRDVWQQGSQATSPSPVQLRPDKRPRPIVLRANVGDCLRVRFTNNTEAYADSPITPQVSLHVEGMELLNDIPGNSILNDASFNGANQTSLTESAATRVYTIFAKAPGTFLLTTEGDSSTVGQQLLNGLFGAVNVQPQGAEWYRSQVTAEDLEYATKVKTNPQGTPIPGPNQKPQRMYTSDGQPIIDYNALYPADYDVTHPQPANSTPRACTPVLKMADVRYAPDAAGKKCVLVANSGIEIYHTDLTAIITGPHAGAFTAEEARSPSFRENPALPNRREPYREFTIIYHETPDAVQSFPIFSDTSANGIGNITGAGLDQFSINYGTGAIAPEIYANRLGVGPMGNCVDCKFEEFFLSAWPVGDPAMLVDVPANASASNTPCTTPDFEKGNPCGGTRNPQDPTKYPYTMTGLQKASKAFFADDPSNVYHSYMSDHVIFRILHGGTGLTHVHHQHAHQWLYSPNNDNASYLDSQMISPGASYSLEMVYNGSGNRNKTVGDSIFHCHFYPHFASGMWGMWRVHDVFEAGTQLAGSGGSPAVFNTTAAPAAFSRALPDGEIIAGTPIPALVPVPTLPMAPTPAYVNIQTNVKVNGALINYGGQVVLQGKCQNNLIDGYTIANGGTCVNGNSYYGKLVVNQFLIKSDQTMPDNPGYPFFIPGIAGARAPHPPLDFAKDESGKILDGGLPRHMVTGGSFRQSLMTITDWSKDFESLQATQLPEDGTVAEKAAMKYHGQRFHPSFLPNGEGGKYFVLNGLPRGPQPGAPYADPAVDDNGNPVGTLRRYKAAVIQTDVAFNKQGWHYPQERILTFWKDADPTYTGTRKAEPLFFRANSGDVVEFWHTNLVPNYYALDDFQVRTPTDIIGQHIHLVKFDVTSSDGAANGFNYEDGTFSPGEVQEIITATTKTGGSWQPLDPTQGTTLQATLPPTNILKCPSLPPNGKYPPGTDPRCKLCSDSNPTVPGQPDTICFSWIGAQTTVQRWYVDPLTNNNGEDRTLRTVFTHDHFGPSTHQQVGLYAGLVSEPAGSTWWTPDGQTQLGEPEGTGIVNGKSLSYVAANILTPRTEDSYREFLLEFQDLQLAYQPNSKAHKDAQGRLIDFQDPNNAIDAPNPPYVQLITARAGVGTRSVNYSNDPIPFRNIIAPTNPCPAKGDLSYVFSSICWGDPATPLLKAYENDKVQIRVLVGAHVTAHYFNIHGLKWLIEPSWKDSGYRATQPMGISEHFEMLFTVPTTSSSNTPSRCPSGTCGKADYLYVPSSDDIGYTNGMWGIFRAFDPAAPLPTLALLPNNKSGSGIKAADAVCPSNTPTRRFKVTAITAQQSLKNGQLVYNSRGIGTGGDPTTQIINPFGITYVRSADLDSNGNLKAGVPNDPLVLRASAGECIEVTLTNAFNPKSINPQLNIFTQNTPANNALGAPFTQMLVNGKVTPVTITQNTSPYVGLHPELLSYDVIQNDGSNIGYNADQVVPPATTATNQQSRTYRWYAGIVEAHEDGSVKGIPVEFGSLNLLPSDPLLQHPNGLIGAMIIEPEGSSWREDQNSRASATVTKKDGSTFREFVVMMQDDLQMYVNSTTAAGENCTAAPCSIAGNDTGGVNNGAEPLDYRYNNLGGNYDPNSLNASALSNQLVLADPETPTFTAAAGTPVRFRMIHPLGKGNGEVIKINGHVWQRQPYVKNSTEIGDNQLSEWIGARDNHGATDHFDVVINKAGGEFAVPGDYLYTTFLPDTKASRTWGIFRVAEPGRDTVTITRVKDFASGSSPSLTSVEGINTVNPGTGRYARSVNVYIGKWPDSLLVGTADVNPGNGKWSFQCATANCGIATNDNSSSLDRLYVSAVSTDGGIAAAPHSVNPNPPAAARVAALRATRVTTFRAPRTSGSQANLNVIQGLRKPSTSNKKSRDAVRDSTKTAPTSKTKN
jgi:hypothetical protein